MSSAATVEHDGFIDTYAAVPVERFDEAAQPDDDLRDDIIHAHNLHKTCQPHAASTLFPRLRSPPLAVPCFH